MAHGLAPDTIVICGSMSQYSCMVDLQRELHEHSIRVIAPANESALPHNLTAKQFFAFKRSVSERYFRIIRQREIFGILVVNNPKHGIDNYIGANTFAEIAIAVNARKKIYLLHDHYEPLRDELIAWEARTMNGSLKPIIEEVLWAKNVANQQLQFPLTGIATEENYAYHFER